jgi:predicted lipid-binding transport protein (Tim44 family)
MNRKQQTVGMFGIAILLLAAGVVMTIMQRTQPKPESTEVKQQSIPLSADDYADDPRLQAAVQQQLQQQQATPQATGQGQTSQDATLLQPVQTGIPTE